MFWVSAGPNSPSADPWADNVKRSSGWTHLIFLLRKFISSFVLRSLTCCIPRMRYGSVVLDLPFRRITENFKWGNPVCLGVMKPGDCLAEVPGEINCIACWGKGGLSLPRVISRILSKGDTLHIDQILPLIPSCYQLCQAGLKHVTSVHSCKLGWVWEGATELPEVPATSFLFHQVLFKCCIELSPHENIFQK